MRLGVNARRLAGQRLGVARYIEHLAKDWAEMLEPDEESILFLREPLDPDDLPERHERRVLRSRFDGILWENLVLGRAARSAGLDVLFCPGYTAPATYRERTVVAIHSANEAEAGADPWWYRFTYAPVYKSSARRAARVILPSYSTLEDIRALYRIPDEKLVVVHLGADEAFRPIDQEETLRDIRREYVGGDRPFAVFVGKLSQRRNIPLLIEAFAEAKRRTGMPHALLLFGPNHLHLPLERLAFEHGVADSVVQVDGEVPSHDRLALVYNAADLFVSASAYEGLLAAARRGTRLRDAERRHEPRRPRGNRGRRGAARRRVEHVGSRRRNRARRQRRIVAERTADARARAGAGVYVPRSGAPDTRRAPRGRGVKTVILAGGLGTRLAEQTDVLPKTMVPVGGRPMLWHIMGIYAAAGFNEFLVALGYKADVVKQWFLNYYYVRNDFTLRTVDGHLEVHDAEQEDWLVHLIDTGISTETGGRVKRLAPWLGDETFLLTYGDGLADVDVRKIVEFHRSHGKLATVTAVRPPSRFGGLSFDGDNVVEFSEKPQIGEGWINGGFFVLEPKVLDYIDADETIFEREPLERLARDDQLVAYRHEGFWQCMDTLRDLRLLESLWESGEVPWKVWA